MIVSTGFLLTFLMAFMCSQDWTDEPTSSSVKQIPIEHIIFPAVTICPLIKVETEDKDDDDDDSFKVRSLVQNCSFNKNNEDTGNVCDTIQEIHNENGVCLTVNNIDISPNTSKAPEKVTSINITKLSVMKSRVLKN